MMIRSYSIAGIAFLSIFPVVAAAQQRGVSQTPKVPTVFTAADTEEDFLGGAGVPSRRFGSRTESNGREVVKETIEMPDMDGRFRMSREVTTETVRTATGAQVKRDIYWPDAQGRTSLFERTQTDVETNKDGSGRNVSTTFKPDQNGRLEFSIQQVQEVKVPSPGVTQTDTSVFFPGINQTLIERERLQKTERKVGNDVTQTESKLSLRDGNGRWQTSETRNLEERASGNQRTSEETILRLNDTGALALSEKHVTTQSKGSGGDQTVTETFFAKSGKLVLEQRTKVTTSSAGATQETVREVEGRNPASPYDPIRVIERTVETMRQIGPDRWEIEKKVFALDGNGRLTPVVTQKGVATGK